MQIIMPPPDADYPILSPAPRPFGHHNISNPRISWGGKFEKGCVTGLSTTPVNYLLGDSSIERLSRPSLLSLSQARLPGWANRGCGGDKVEHALWRLMHGGTPSVAGKCILSIGSNNLKLTPMQKLAGLLRTQFWPQLGTY